jgi:hypothetical protein
MWAALAAVVAVASVVVAEPRLPLAVVALPPPVPLQLLVPADPHPRRELAAPLPAQLPVRADEALEPAVPVELPLSRRSHSAAMARKPS